MSAIVVFLGKGQVWGGKRLTFVSSAEVNVSTDC